MAADPLFGWDLTFKTVETDVKQKSDVIVAFIHWNLMKRGFRSIGIGDERTVSGDENKTELLPPGWNANENYTVRYLLDTKLYILHGLKTDGNLIFNLMRSEDLAVSNIVIKTDDAVVEMHGSIDKMIPGHKDLMYMIKRDLIDTLTDKPTVAAQTQTVTNASNYRQPLYDPLRDLSRPMSGPHVSGTAPWGAEPPQAPNIGRSDLDPFAPMGSGMIFNPLAPGRGIIAPGLGIPGGLPRGAVPPGARFDPFGPPAGPMPGRRPPPPDADHLPPPGFNDNMFL